MLCDITFSMLQWRSELSPWCNQVLFGLLSLPPSLYPRVIPSDPPTWSCRTRASYQMCHLQNFQMDSILLWARLLESMLSVMLQWLQGSLLRKYDVFVPGNTEQSKNTEILKPLHLCHPAPDFPLIPTNWVFKTAY